VPEPSSYDYAVVRLVPDLERGEFLNVGVILFSKAQRMLVARVGVDEDRFHRLSPGADIETVRAHLTSIERIAAGGRGAGSLGHLSASQRFHWLVAPRSTMIQVSAVHSGLCSDPGAELDRLYRRLVETSALA
jgi:hypothetical protein